jgi:hypothetical protein
MDGPQVGSKNKKPTSRAAEQCVHLTGGILRHFRAFSTPEQNPALEILSTPAHPQVTQTVSLLCQNMSFDKDLLGLTTQEKTVQIPSGGIRWMKNKENGRNNTPAI